MTDSSDGEGWLEISGYLVLFAGVIYLLCHTADNFFSPVLAAICDLLDMSPDIAGVTFLAFGNGAPDVFSSLVALSSASADRQGALLVGVASLLGAALITITVVVGGVVHIKPTGVPPVPFMRDVIFLFLAIGMILISAAVQEITWWMALLYLSMYSVYVLFVFKGPGSGSKTLPSTAAGNASPHGLEVSGLRDLGNDDCVGFLDENAIDARWIPANSEDGGRGESGSLKNKEQSIGFPKRDRRGGRGGGGVTGKRADGSDLSGRGISVTDDYFQARGEGSSEEEGSLLGRGGPRRREYDGGSDVDGDVRSMVPGSTVSMFLEEDDSAASWLAQRQSGSTGQFYVENRENRGRSEGSYGSRAMREPLLTGDAPRVLAQVPLADAESGPGLAFSSQEISLSRRRFEHAWASIQWKQWRMRRRIRRELGNSDMLQLPWYRKVFYAIELPFILVRNATIPPVEEDSWSQTMAALSTALAPTLAVWAFGLWGTGFLGVSSDYFTYGLVAALVGVPAGVAVWLTTHKRRMPDDRWYRLSLALVAFVSCVAWIYYLADRAVTLIENIGSATGISSSVLGLTFLAWGNSSGDLVTNLAVARAGYPGMAIAGSYGGPLLNISLGIGLPMLWNCAVNYPDPSVFRLDTATVFTAGVAAFVLMVTLPAVAWSGFRFPDKAPLALLGSYATYVAAALFVTLS